jgi:transposase
MEKEDGRGLGTGALGERRKIIIRMKENGYRPAEIVQATGCSRQSIYPLWNKWRNSKGRGKQQVLCVQHRGTGEGQYRTLTPEQERGIQRMIKDKYPDQLKPDFALWTRKR